MDTMNLSAEAREFYEGLIAKFKEEHLKGAKLELHETGEVKPSASFLVIKEDTRTINVLIAPLEHVQTGPGSSDLIANMLVPSMIEEIAKNHGVPLAFSYISEGLMRTAKLPEGTKSSSKNMLDHVPADWKDLPTERVLNFTFETQHEEDTQFFKILETGDKHLNEEGDLVDTCELHEVSFGEPGEKDAKPKSSGGTMHGMFRKHYHKHEPGRVPTGL